MGGPSEGGMVMEGCLFCRIAAKELPTQIIAEDEDTLAFTDIRPQAPVHVLLIPKVHVDSLAEAGEKREMLGRLLDTARGLAAKLGLAEKGFRVVINTNDDGGQTVHHLHLHILGGRQMRWPPG